MFSKVSVLVPTRHRVERLRTLLDSFERTVADRSRCELVFRVDDDDTETQAFLAREAMFVGPRLHGYQSMSTFYNELFATATGDILMCGNDDMVFKTPRWPSMILEVANRYPDGLFDLGVTTHNEMHYPFSIVSKAVAEHLGFLWDPRIFWGDIFLRDTMAAFDRCVMIPHVHVDHDWAGNDPDEVFLETRVSKTQCEGDPSYWANVHAPAVNDAVQRLRTLL